ncbi:mobile mystery protein B [Mariniblastus fucicola]|uniref:Adenosine monophosphate-protein transferase NmFic n=1 Tax=Mariniblastus fucicola TaxID=980251 RepID=A0A5B9PEM8_9BACT|nr:mobile mystery protein B [Mariniblastus fucicola]QEG25187.1 Adenosine monophosphate-protein transferase NmFic [Mariniblastus fucicola]
MSKIVGEPYGATPLDPDELKGLKHKHVRTRGQLDELEQFNIQEGLKWLNQLKKVELFCDSFARELHEKLFGQVWDWAGTFRLTEKSIGIVPYQIPVQLRQLLDNARYWVEHQTYSPLEFAARFHHKLVFIHPFPNGNGRHARIMADTVLTKVLGQKPIDWAGGFDIQRMSSRRTQYIEALRAADGGDIGPLLAFVS